MKNKGKYLILLLGAFLIGTLFTTFGQTAVQTIAGLAVAQSAGLWNNIKDAAFGDNATTGIMATNPYLFDGTNFDRARGDTTNGLDVDVTRVSGNVAVIGTSTVADNTTTSTAALQTHAFNALYDGTNWDMQRSFANNVDNVTAVAVTTSGIGGVINFPYIYDIAGTNWDRLTSTVHGDNITTTNMPNGANVASIPYLFDGSNYDRSKSFATNVDGVTAVAVTTSGISGAVTFPYVLNGSGTFDRIASGIATGSVLMDMSSNASSNITTNTTTAVKATAGILNRIIINAAGTTSTVALYNIASAGCTGTPGSGFIGTLATTTAFLALEYNHTFTLGICAVTAGAAAADISALYR